jgi:hypothetical protein
MRAQHLAQGKHHLFRDEATEGQNDAVLADGLMEALILLCEKASAPA